MYGYLIQGEFDDNLQWPFQHAITIQLLNQLENTNHYTYTFDFTKSRNLKSIGRVTFTDIAGSGWGSRTFKSHSNHGLNTDKGCQYLKDDQLKFRVLSAAYLKLPKWKDASEVYLYMHLCSFLYSQCVNYIYYLNYCSSLPYAMLSKYNMILCCPDMLFFTYAAVLFYKSSTACHLKWTCVNPLCKVLSLSITLW